MKMKKFLIGATLVALYASPVLAHDYRVGGTMPSVRMMHQLRGINAMAPADAVFLNGHIVGADPDPNVRLSFQRDPEPWNR
jgi:hypothetical protein